MQVKLLRPNRKQSNSFLNESVNEKYFGDIDDTSLRIVKLRLICGGIMESIQAQVFCACGYFARLVWTAGSFCAPPHPHWRAYFIFWLLCCASRILCYPVFYSMQWIVEYVVCCSLYCHYCVMYCAVARAVWYDMVCYRCCTVYCLVYCTV